MPVGEPSASLVPVAVFAPEAYGRLPRRFVAWTVDGGLLLVAVIALMSGSYEWGIDAGSWWKPAFIAMAGIYLVPIRAWVGTLGYRLAGLVLVDDQGCRPNAWRLAGRYAWLALLVWIGPLNLMTVVDLLWASGDAQAQTLHDKISRTYVVRRGARPIERRPERVVLLTYFGAMLTVREVAPPPARFPG